MSHFLRPFALFILAACALVGLTLNAIPPARAAIPCDINADGSVSMADLLLIRAGLNTPVSPPGSDPRDANSDGVINVADMRYCQLRCTLPACANP